jgi:hypothetical protein
MMMMMMMIRMTMTMTDACVCLPEEEVEEEERLGDGAPVLLGHLGPELVQRDAVRSHHMTRSRVAHQYLVSKRCMHRT